MTNEYPQDAEAQNSLILQAGNLASLSSFHYHITDGLIRYSKQYMTGYRPDVRLNLSDIYPQKIGMAALTALLSTADRLREFTLKPLPVYINWNPEIFAFFDDIGFFELSEERDLFQWQEGIIGGYSRGKTNPNTQLLFFERSSKLANYDKHNLPSIKDAIREDVKERLMLRCGELFRGHRGGTMLSVALRDQIAITSAELVVNAQLWGRTHAFVGLQRTSKRITVCVCDSGDGFHGSLGKKERLTQKPTGHLDSLAIGCVLNRDDFGLRRAIDMVTRYPGGWVELHSYNAEIVWREQIWSHWVDGETSSHNDWFDRFASMKDRFKPDDNNKKEKGYWRELSKSLRGTRVTFEIALEE